MAGWKLIKIGTSVAVAAGIGYGALQVRKEPNPDISSQLATTIIDTFWILYGCRVVF